MSVCMMDDSPWCMRGTCADCDAARDTEFRRAGSCPCLHTEPCSAQCSCAMPVMSGGCRRCCGYGSPEQQRAMAERIARLIRLGEDEERRRGLGF